MFMQVERADGKTEQIDRRPLLSPILDSCHLNYVVPQFQSEHVVAIPDSKGQTLFPCHNYGRLGGVAKY